MMSLTFAPLVSPLFIAAIGVLSVGVSLFAISRRTHGSVYRFIAFVVALLWLANPIVKRIVYKLAPSEVAVIIDRSASMEEAQRRDIAAEVLATLKNAARLGSGLTLRFFDSDRNQLGTTQLFKTLEDADISPQRFAGAIFVTDGMIHDVPTDLPNIFAADNSHAARPLDVILTGRGEEQDRRLEVLEAPTYGIVGKTISIVVRTTDAGRQGSVPITLSVQVGTELPQSIKSRTGVRQTLNLPVKTAGEMLIVLRAPSLPGEVSTRNNVATLRINGIRERLKVLLISGAPNPGERVWRRLLRADPSVDLVHFTILRAPDQDDGTPTDEMALVVFPTKQLFQEKIGQFDLIILDGFATMGLLPDAYMENIANFVRKGGGLLLATGPEFLEDGSLKDTPLSSILPAQVVADGVSNTKFIPELTALGRRHPVVATLPQPWGPWYRSLEVNANSIKGTVVMQTDESRPLLILDDVEKGRVAMLLSDQLWLWSRGEGGGGPQVELLRRLSHWLMKDPTLEAERLSGNISHGILHVTRTSLQANLTSAAHITGANGASFDLPLKRRSDGIFDGQTSVPPGSDIWTIRQDNLKAVVAPDWTPSPESQDLRATASRLKPLVTKSHGHILWSSELKPEFKLATEGRERRDIWTFPAGYAVDPQQTRDVRLVPSLAALILVILFTFLGWLRERKF